MPVFSSKSLSNLKECDPQLQELFFEVIKTVDCSITCGHRPQVEQHEAFLSGKSEVDWPDSKHNLTPSKALDAYPYYPGGIRWKDTQGHYFFAGRVKEIANRLGINLRCGADFDGDNDTQDQKLHDPGHFEVE